jgi:hypothetical protein
LHDLATSIAATPNGLAGLRQDIRLPWRGLELSGAVVEALCERWHVPSGKVVRRRSLQERRTLVIGKVGARNIRALAYVVYKPKAT